MKRTVLAAALSLASLACFAAEGRVVGTHASTGAKATTASTGGMPFHIDQVLESFGGTAVEVIPVSGYVYVRVDTGSEARWVVSLKKQIAVGDHVGVRSFGTQKDFESPKLHRIFPQLWFAVIHVETT